MELTDYQKKIAIDISEAGNKGYAIKHFREINGLTQQEVAKSMNWGQSVVADYESNRRNPKQETIYRFAIALSEKGKKSRGYRYPKYLSKNKIESLKNHMPISSQNLLSSF